MPFTVGAILLLSVAAGERRNSMQIAGTLAVLSWPTIARVTRTVSMSVLSMPFVATIAAPAFGLFVGAEASLSYLGVGLTAPTVSWGTMIADAQDHFERSPHLVLVPGAFLATTVAAFLLIADALGESLDPRLQRA